MRLDPVQTSFCLSDTETQPLWQKPKHFSSDLPSFVCAAASVTHIHTHAHTNACLCCVTASQGKAQQTNKGFLLSLMSYLHAKKFWAAPTPLLPKNCVQRCRLVPNSDCGEIMTDWLWVFLAYTCMVACVGLKKELFTRLSIVIKNISLPFDWRSWMECISQNSANKLRTRVFSPCVFLAALLYIAVRRHVHVLTRACSQCVCAAETSDKDPRRYSEFQYHTHTHTHGHTNVGLVVGCANKEIIMRGHQQLGYHRGVTLLFLSVCNLKSLSMVKKKLDFPPRTTG